ncbi:MAG: hypothetical protein RJB66_800 [Pseudomonadota bacterium]|jgi:hypothetical protein
MRHFLGRVKILTFAHAMAVLVSSSSYATDFVMTADMTKVLCSNGQEFVLEPFQMLEFQESVDRGTYKVRLPSTLSRDCVEATVQSMDVYHVGNIGTVPRSLPRSTPKVSPEPSLVVKPRESSIVKSTESKSEEQPSNELDEPVVESTRNLVVAEEKPIARQGSNSRMNRVPKKESEKLNLTPRPAVPEELSNQGNDGSVLKTSQSTNAFLFKNTKRMAPQCRAQFLGENGLGPWGEHAVETMSLGFFEDTLKNNQTAFAQICPGYRSMSVAQKKHLIVITLMSQANFESSCNPRATNANCPNGVCAGIFQLHKGKENKYVSTPEFKEFCPRNASSSPTKSISCSLAMFMEDLWQGESIVGNRSSYWEVLAPQYAHSKVGDLRSLMAKIPDCKTNKRISNENSDGPRLARSKSQRLKRNNRTEQLFPDSPMSEDFTGVQ